MAEEQIRFMINLCIKIVQSLSIFFFSNNCSNVVVDELRVYEPDPLKMTSIAELETSEKNVVETLSRVMQRKV
jgi:hypothetical protein